MSSSVDAANRALRTAVLWGAIVAIAVGFGGGAIGYSVAGLTGVWSALAGSVVAFIFMGITAGSILLGLRVGSGNIVSGAFFIIVLGAWLVKFVLFLFVAVFLKDSGLFNVPVAFGCLIAAVIGALASDIVAISKARIPAVDMIGS